MDTKISLIIVLEDSNVISLANSSNLKEQSLEHLKWDPNSKLEFLNAELVENLAKKLCNSSNTPNQKSVYLKIVTKILGNSKCRGLNLQISRR